MILADRVENSDDGDGIVGDCWRRRLKKSYLCPEKESRKIPTKRTWISDGVEVVWLAAFGEELATKGKPVEAEEEDADGILVQE